MLIAERSEKTRIITLTDQLQSGIIAFEHFASVITDKKLQEILRDIMHELSRYIAEISSELFKADPVLHFKCSPATQDSSHGNAAYPGSRTVKDGDEKILEQSCACEKGMITAYREVLNELFLAPELKTKLRYQLNGIMYCFSRLKLLKSTTSPKSNAAKAVTTHLL